jgi:hypothetical protein
MKARPHSYLVEGLEELVEQCPSGKMAEIGVFVGESTEIFAKSGKFERIVAVDAWLNGYDSRDPISNSADMDQSEREFDKVCTKYPCINKVKADSLTAARFYPDEYFDLVYLDANHTFKGVTEDLEAWLPKVKKSGWIAGHDYKIFPGVTHAVNALGKYKKQCIMYWKDYSWAIAKGDLDGR